LTDSDTYFELQQFYAKQTHSLDAGDADGFAATFTTDGVFIHHLRDEVHGRDAILEATRKGVERTRSLGIVRRHWFGIPEITEGPDNTIHTRYSAITSAVNAAGEVRLEPTCMVEDVLVINPEGGYLNHSRTIRRDDLEVAQ
jgi:actinorhodin biosynthesis protein ActVIA